MVKGDLYQVSQGSQISPLLWHRYVRQVDTAAVLDRPLTVDVLLWHNSLRVSLPRWQLHAVAHAQEVAAVTYARRILAGTGPWPKTLNRLYEVGREFYDALAVLHSDINTDGPARNMLLFANEAELETYLAKELEFSASEIAEAVQHWRIALGWAEQLTVAERDYFN